MIGEFYVDNNGWLIEYKGKEKDIGSWINCPAP